MRIIEARFRKGIVKLMPETTDDLWVLYNIIKPGDLVTAKTTRDVKGEGGSRRLPMVLTIKVIGLEFQPFTSRLRIRGIVVEGPEKFGVKGKHHTLNVDVGTVLTITKDTWPDYIIKKLESVTRARESILLIALDYDDAAIGILGHQGLRILCEIASRLPGKDSDQFQRVLVNYLKKVSDEALKYVNRYGVKAIIIASPGYLKNEVKNLILEKIHNVNVYLDTVSTGGLSGLYELSRRDIIKRVLSDLEVVKAISLIDEFMKLLVTNDSLIAYGLEEVELAVISNAVKKLLIAESMLRTNDPSYRERVDKLLNEADKRGAEIIIAPQDSEAEKRVIGLGGIIAILRYPFKARSMLNT